MYLNSTIYPLDCAFRLVLREEIVTHVFDSPIAVGGEILLQNLFQRSYERCSHTASCIPRCSSNMELAY